MFLSTTPVHTWIMDVMWRQGWIRLLCDGGHGHGRLRRRWWIRVWSEHWLPGRMAQIKRWRPMIVV